MVPEKFIACRICINNFSLGGSSLGSSATPSANFATVHPAGFVKSICPNFSDWEKTECSISRDILINKKQLVRMIKSLLNFYKLNSPVICFACRVIILINRLTFSFTICLHTAFVNTKFFC